MTVELEQPEAEGELERLRVEAAAVKVTMQRLEAAAKSLDGALNAWRDGRVLEALGRLDELDESPASPEVVARLRQAIEPAAQQLLDALDSRVIDALHHAGIPIDSSSRFPHLTMEEQLIDLDVDPRKRTATVRARDGKKVRTTVDPAAVAGTVLAERAHALEFDIESTVFLDLVAIHCEAEAAKDTGVTSLRRVQERVAKSRKDIDAVRFNVLLSKALSARATTSDGRHPRLSHTKDVKNGVLIWRREGGGYVGYIEFVDEVGT